jgi:hypothetical protein
VFIPSFHNYRIWSFLGLVMTTYTAWYLAVASILHGQVACPLMPLIRVASVFVVEAFRLVNGR